MGGEKTRKTLAIHLHSTLDRGQKVRIDRHAKGVTYSLRRVGVPLKILAHVKWGISDYNLHIGLVMDIVPFASLRREKKEGNRDD